MEERGGRERCTRGAPRGEKTKQKHTYGEREASVRRVGGPAHDGAAELAELGGDEHTHTHINTSTHQNTLT